MAFADSHLVPSTPATSISVSVLDHGLEFIMFACGCLDLSIISSLASGPSTRCSVTFGSISSHLKNLHSFFSTVKVQISQAYRKVDITRELISISFDATDRLLSLPMCFSFVRVAVACAVLERPSCLEPTFEAVTPRYLKLVTVPNFCLLYPFMLTLKALNKNCSRRHFNFLLFSFEENKAWCFKWILCLAEDSHETSSLIFSEKQWKNIYECCLLQSCLAL